MTDKPVACVALSLESDLRDRIAGACETVDVAPGAPPGALAAALAGAHGLAISNQSPVGAELLARAPALRVVSGFGVGYDRFDIAAASARGIAVCNTPDVVTEPVVNLTFGLLLALSRRLVEHAAFTRSEGWATGLPAPALGRDLRGKTLGLIGFGRIGREVARRAPVFGLRVLYCDVFDTTPPDAPDVPRRDLDSLLRESDIASLHVDLNPSSHHLISTRELALMKRDAWLINTSRGGVVDQGALMRAVRAGAIGGTALDVLETEPPARDEPLLELPNVIVTPHIGTATVETRRAMAELCVDNLLDVLAGRAPRACVNPEALAQR